MSRQLVDEMKLYELQQKIPNLDSDQIGDFCFYLGDLNYRLKTSFTDLNNENVRQNAVGMVKSHDQLIEALAEGYYPGYAESQIDFIPSYKMSTEEESYVNKRD